ncbi:MAG: hypothetical protein HYS70_01675 [Nitrospinae bacterium]|nr:hypothetical protein [Nitrospinota bacterium]
MWVMRKRLAKGLIWLLGPGAIFVVQASAQIGQAPARNHPPKISSKYSEYKRVVKFFLYNDGQLDPKEKEILRNLEERFQISSEEASQIARDIEMNLDRFPR